MHILYVSHTHPAPDSILENVGGMQRVSIQLVRELERKESIHVEKETVNVSGKGGIALATFLFLAKQLFNLPRSVRRNDIDLVVFSSMVTASLAYFVRGKIDKPMVAINHGRDVTLPSRLYQLFLPRVLDSLDGIISVSEATRRECIKRGMPPGKGVALPNGFDFQKFSDFPDKQSSRKYFQEEFGLSLDRHRMLLTVGRLVMRKGHEWFIRNVLPKISSDVIYVIIGDGEERSRIESAAGYSPCRDRIFMLGEQPDGLLKKAYAAADIFVMPNIPVEGDMEGFGIVLLEANMAETPAVAADLEGIKDVIMDGKNGFKIPVKNSVQFVKQIDELLSGNLQEFSEQTRKYVQEHFSWRTVTEQYLSYFEQVIDRFQNKNS